MESLPVVKDFDPFEDGLASNTTGEPPLSGDEFWFEGGEEALRHRVVAAATGSTH